MSWFGGKKEVQNGYQMNEIDDDIPRLEELPELPELPPLPNTEKPRYSQERMQPLPSLPPSRAGNKFSQSMIKEAVSENDVERYDSEDMPRFKQFSKDIDEEQEETPYQFREAARKVRRAEPIYVRLDKFEDSLEVFEGMKNKVEEIKDLLREIKEKKAREEQEIAKWETELQSMKSQIDRIDREIFSRVE